MKTFDRPGIGDVAPPFDAPRDGGSTLSLAGFRGGFVVLYFYPRDDTPGCTTEALDFTRLAEDFAAAGATVIGVSRDPVAKHERFRDKHDLGIALVSDEDGSISEAYGVWVEKAMYGRRFMGIERTTFLIDGEGRIVQVWPKVTVKDHAADVLEALRTLTSSA